MKRQFQLKYLIISLIFIICFVVYLVINQDNITNLTKLTTIKTRINRKYIHNKEQLKLTEIIKIMPKHCDHSHPISVFINSAANYYRRRQIQRNTWVSDVKKHNICIYFVVGMSDNQNDEQIIQKESKRFGDLIQFGFIDNYYNNTLKGISVLRWIHKHCNRSQFILKTDDDVLVNIEIFLKTLHKFEHGIHGLLYRRVKANRNEKSKWYMPNKYYSKIFYPVYTPGVAYIMSMDVIKSLILGIDSYSGDVIDIDDVFLTGIIANQMGIKRFSTNFIIKGACFNKCNLFKFGVIFGCDKHNQIEKMWFKWKDSNESDCFPK